ncbi:hypothetical protein AVEN_114039-1 [Araneus ventricosus]|uniref:HAT C-terminal dimerisation domain-containing protein n=1 Tax=Araneus ventricosus TaxID=182803 RepID=A0A4Y2K9M5_ARAVE|nr:hypothetical protein AVEN_114039-1 [Araneus ventricosus]
MASEKDNCKISMKQISLHFCQKNVTEEEGDALMLQFKEFLETTVSKYSASLKNFDPKSDRLDSFLNIFLLQDAANEKLWRVMKILMILSHGQATVERGFSVRKSLEAENLKEDSYIAQRLIFENANNSNNIHSTIIAKEMRRFVFSSRQKYVLHLEEQRKIEHQKNSENSRKRKVDELFKI